MPIDPSIIGRFQQPQIDIAGPLQQMQQNRMAREQFAQNQQLRAEQLKGAQLQNKMGQAELDNLPAKQAFAQRKMALEWEKMSAEEKKSKLELGIAQAGRLGALAASVKDEASKQQAIQQAVQEQLLDPERAQQMLQTPFDPATYQGFVQQAMTVQQQAAEAHRKIDEDERARHNKELEEAAKRPKPGIDVPYPAAVANQKAQIAAASRAPDKPGADIEKYNYAVRQGFKGTLEDWIKKTGMRSNPSEGERRAFTFYGRARDAENTISGLEDKIANLSLGGQTRLKYAPNVMQSDDGQLYTQAQRQFTEARLRKDSGAMITNSEYLRDAQTFFAQPGDSKETIARKRNARSIILKTLQKESGRAYDDTYGPETETVKPKSDPMGLF